MEELIKNFYQAIQTATGGKVFAQFAPDNQELPFAVYFVADVEEENFVAAGQLIERAEFEVESYAKTYPESLALRKAIQDAVRLMPEFISQVLDESKYYDEDEAHGWVQSFVLRTRILPPF